MAEKTKTEIGRIKKIDHIGIVVSDIKAATRVYEAILFKQPSYTEYVAEKKVDLVFFDIGEVQIELLAPRTSDSEIAFFLKNRGEGLHHICYEVEGIGKILETLRKEGFKFIDEKPRPGSRNTQVFFVDSISTRGVYTEYCEFPNSYSNQNL